MPTVWTSETQAPSNGPQWYDADSSIAVAKEEENEESVSDVIEALKGRLNHHNSAGDSDADDQQALM